MAKKRLSQTAGRDVSNYIREHLGESLSYTTIDELCGTSSSAQQYNLIVGPLLKDNVLSVQSKRLMRGNEHAPIYHTYRICKKLPARLPHSGAFMERGANMGTLDAALVDLNPRLTQNGFLSKNLEAAQAWHDQLLQFGAWLDDHAELVGPAIAEERSFEVFRNEKLLTQNCERKGGRTLTELINNIGLLGELNIRGEVAKELVYYVPRTLRRTLLILVVENHAPFVHVQEALSRGVRVFFGKHVDGVIYGQGSNATAESLAMTERYFANGCSVRYWYWGDIDRPGIEVYERLAEHVDVKPLIAAYEAMIAHAGEDLPVSAATGMPPHMGVSIAQQLDPRDLEVFMRVIACGLRIPQEAVPVVLYDGRHPTRRLTETFRAAR